MVSTQDILNNIINMQRNAQEALPIIPNNGNPGGANNMPRAAAPPMSVPLPAQQRAPAPPMAAPQQPVEDKWGWLKASPAMSNVRKMLDARRGTMSPAAIGTGVQTAMDQYDLPVLPMRNVQF